MQGDHRSTRELRARKELNHAKRQVDLFRNRLMMSGHEPSMMKAYQDAQKDYEKKWQALLELTIPDVAGVK